MKKTTIKELAQQGLSQEDNIQVHQQVSLMLNHFHTLLETGSDKVLIEFKIGLLLEIEKQDALVPVLKQMIAIIDKQIGSLDK